MAYLEGLDHEGLIKLEFDESTPGIEEEMPDARGEFFGSDNSPQRRVVEVADAPVFDISDMKSEFEKLR